MATAVYQPRYDGNGGFYCGKCHLAHGKAVTLTSVNHDGKKVIGAFRCPGCKSTYVQRPTSMLFRIIEEPSDFTAEMNKMLTNADDS